jgi:hypothetical protein
MKIFLQLIGELSLVPAIAANSFLAGFGWLIS